MLELFVWADAGVVGMDHDVFVDLGPPRAPLISEFVQAPVTGDAEQPRPARCAVLERVEIPECFEEGLLPHLLGEGAVSEDANAEPEQSAPVRTHEVDDRGAPLARARSGSPYIRSCAARSDDARPWTGRAGDGNRGRREIAILHRRVR